jgi:parallel beta-helix repeat protein
MRALLLFLLLIPAVAAECEEGYDLMRITKDTILCNKVFDAQNGIYVLADDVTLDCNGAIIRGTGLQDGQGITLDSVTGATIKNCNLLNFDVGIYVKDSNRNTIIQNALLKNKIGVRMLNAFENRFESNADKSILKPVSAIASKFNTFQLTNKELDRDFCEVNLCNQPGLMDPCANDDFYCSPRCSHENDNDCPAPEEEKPAEVKEAAVPTPEPAAQPPKETPSLPSAPSRVTGEVFHESFMDWLPFKARFWTMAFLFILSYIIGFLVFQHHHYNHSRK